MYVAVSQDLLSRGHGLLLIRALLVLKLIQVYEMSEGWGTTFYCVESRPMLYWIIGLYILFFFFKLYNIVLVLPNIKMNPPQVYPRSPS